MKFEKYFDETHQRHYYYSRETDESLWELPDGAEVIDMTQESSIQSKAVQDYEAHKQLVEKQQRETLESLYPEFFSNQQPEAVTHQEQQDDAALEQFKD